MATATKARTTTRKAAQSDTVQRLARGGLVARGCLYAVVGVLAANLARGSSSQADKNGALRAVGERPFGRWLLVLAAIGFAGYAIWRLAEAVRPSDDGALKRVGSGFRALLYAAFAWTTLSFVLTHHSENADARERDVTARVLGWPGGRWLVLGIGVAVIAVGLFSTYRAVSGRYRKHLKEHEIPRATLRWLKPVAYAGLVARTAAFSLVGAFLVQAAWTYDASKARGLDDSLRTLARAPYGEQLILLVGIGLVAFGLWCFVEARYRDVLGS